MLATFIRRLLCVVFQIANSFIACAPINPITNPGPLTLTIRQTVSGVKRFPNCAVRAPIAELSAGKRARLRVITAIPAPMAGVIAIVFW